MNKHALIVTYDKFPAGDAGAIRLYIFARMLEEMNYSVFVIGMGPPTNSSDIKQYNNTSYVSLRKDRKGVRAKLCNYLGYNNSLKKWLNVIPRQDVVLVTNLPIRAMNTIKKYTEKKHSTLIYDAVEWYSPEQFALRKLSFLYINNNFINKYYLKKPWRIISISHYLQDYFSKKGLQTQRIPAIMEAGKCSENNFRLNSKITIAYFGSPGKKDCFENFIKGLLLLPDDYSQKIIIKIIGITEQVFLKTNKIDSEQYNRIKGNFRFLGRISHEDVLKELDTVNYTFFMRNADMRYAKAGFPSKVTESLSLSIPVICNLSSDLNEYLIDEENSITIKDNNPEAVRNALIRAIDLPVEKQVQMHEKAFETAKSRLDWHLYCDVLKKLM